MLGGDADHVRVVIGSLDDLSMADLKRWMRAHVFAAQQPLEVDLADVGHDYISALITMLVEADARAHAGGTRVVVVNAPEPMRADLAAAGVDLRRRSVAVGVARTRQITFPAPRHRWAERGRSPEHAHDTLAAMYPHLDPSVVAAIFDESVAAARALGVEPVLIRALELARARLAAQ